MRGTERKTERERQERQSEMDREKERLIESKKDSKIKVRERILNHCFTFYNVYKIGIARTFHLIPS